MQGQAIEAGRVDSLGKTLFVAGLVIAGVGAVLWLIGRGGFGWLPGDIVVERKHVRIVFPIVTCLLLSVALSVILWLTRR